MPCNNCNDGICTNRCLPDQHGVAATRGHLADNGGIRGHSAGECFPWVVMQKGERICILTPSGDIYYPALSDWEHAENLAAAMKTQNVRGKCLFGNNNWEVAQR